MTKNAFISLAAALSLLIITSCGNNKGKLLTDRIQYDVTIKTPDVDLEWFVQNLEGPKREKLVQAIINTANSGKLKMYDVMTNKPMTPAELKERSTRKELITLQRAYAPYEDYDSIVSTELQLSDITRVRFLEEWYLNEKNGLITKKVIAICPLVESYTETGELRGYNPLFWLSFEKNFPLEAK
ncbi:MAG: hypothetical protein H6541_01215 [Lentimicrobiaceae bacterium]|nr:hypothetical protein [Lentimicrobiaceae bacterium]MCB9023028.1 hypothetical protein [Lentimicrobiaceae bacterium]MCO5264552.1 hypothetical protein [Lentimicrobium sp.]HPG32856.1 hypothetical protein [Lentimicrobium sp.]